MGREPYIYKEADWTPQNALGTANRSNVYVPIVHYESGGMLFTDERRYKAGQVNHKEYEKYKKEQQMGIAKVSDERSSWLLFYNKRYLQSLSLLENNISPTSK